MFNYKVYYAYRTDDGLLTSRPTHGDCAEVTAENVQAARLKAIDAAYEKHSPCCSHVYIQQVEQL